MADEEFKCYFYTWEELPTISSSPYVPSSKQKKEHENENYMNAISHFLGGKSGEIWEDDFVALTHMQMLSKYSPIFLQNILSKLAAPLSVLCLSLRSSIVRNALLTVQCICRGLAQVGCHNNNSKNNYNGGEYNGDTEITEFFKTLLPALLQKATCEKKFLAEAATQATLQFLCIDMINDGMILVLTNHAFEKNGAIRAKVAYCMYCGLKSLQEAGLWKGLNSCTNETKEKTEAKIGRAEIGEEQREDKNEPSCSPLFYMDERLVLSVVKHLSDKLPTTKEYARQSLRILVSAYGGDTINHCWREILEKKKEEAAAGAAGNIVTLEKSLKTIRSVDTEKQKNTLLAGKTSTSFSFLGSKKTSEKVLFGTRSVEKQEPGDQTRVLSKFSFEKRSGSTSSLVDRNNRSNCNSRISLNDKNVIGIYGNKNNIELEGRGVVQLPCGVPHFQCSSSSSSCSPSLSSSLVSYVSVSPSLASPCSPLHPSSPCGSSTLFPSLFPPSSQSVYPVSPAFFSSSSSSLSQSSRYSSQRCLLSASHCKPARENERGPKSKNATIDSEEGNKSKLSGKDEDSEMCKDDFELPGKTLRSRNDHTDYSKKNSSNSNNSSNNTQLVPESVKFKKNEYTRSNSIDGKNNICMNNECLFSDSENNNNILENTFNCASRKKNFLTSDYRKKNNHVYNNNSDDKGIQPMRADTTDAEDAYKKWRNVSINDNKNQTKLKQSNWKETWKKQRQPLEDLHKTF